VVIHVETPKSTEAVRPDGSLCKAPSDDQKILP
jgi:hypothetical protein